MSSVNEGSQMWSIAMSPDGKKLAVGEWTSKNWHDGTFKLVDIASRREVRRLHTRENPTRLMFSQKGNLLACCATGTIHVFDISAPNAP